ncbi:MAG: hypothetical protein NWQ31_04770, partial [Polaribacter sp.]|nr:hypothetical protein [Polaribacter sp.]
FGVADLLIVTGLTIVFFISFMVIVFYDLYNLSIRKIQFNFLPILIVVIFSISLFIAIKYQGKFLFKNPTKTFVNQIGEVSTSKIILFTDHTFELQQTGKHEVCVKKGTYLFKQDTLFLDKKDKTFKDEVFDSIYYFRKTQNLLIPNNNLLIKFKVNK